MTDEELEKLKEEHAKQIEYLNSRIPVEGLEAILPFRELVSEREYQRRAAIIKKQELKEAFEAGVNSWVNDFEVYDFDDWYKTRGEKL